MEAHYGDLETHPGELEAYFRDVRDKLGAMEAF